MGMLRDIVKKADSSDQVTAETKEALALLMQLAEARAKVFESAIESDLATGKMGEGYLKVAITKVRNSRVEYRAFVQNDANKIVSEATESMKNLFSGDGKVAESLGGLAGTALNTILGAGEGQEAEVRRYAVVVDSRAIVRFDFAFWGRNVTAKSIKTHAESVFACVAYKSAVDVRKLAYNDFLALYAPTLKNAYGNELQRIKDMVVEARGIYEDLARDHGGQGRPHAAMSSFALSLGTIQDENANPDELALIQSSPNEVPMDIKSWRATEGDF